MALTVTPTDEMKTLKVGEKIYEIVDDEARTDLNTVKADLSDLPENGITANSKQLLSENGADNTEPYMFRAVPVNADRAELDAVVGGTVVMNQLFTNGDFSDGTANWETENIGYVTLSASDNVLSVTLARTPTYFYNMGVRQTATTPFVSGHKVLFRFEFNAPKADYMVIRSPSVFGGDGQIDMSFNTPNVWTEFARIAPVIGSGIPYIAPRMSGEVTYDVDEVIKYRNFVAIDLTQMFGSTIADYIYSLETATPGAGVAWFRKLFPADYYPYDAGTLKSVEGVSSHDMVGFNAYNPTTGTAKLVGGQQYQITGAYSALTLDGEAVTPDASGYFTPTKSGTLTVTGGDSTTTCVHLAWDGERDGEYEPYVKHSYPLDSSLTLRGIPKLSDGKLYYDGDRYLPDGTVERNYGIRAYQLGDDNLANAITDGTNTVYKLTASTTETAAPYQSLQVCDPNGTEEFVTTGIVPVGHETRYPENLRAKIEGLPWDFSTLIAPTETGTASRNYTVGSLLIMGNVLYKVTANIANGGTITPGTNCTATTLSEVILALQ